MAAPNQLTRKPQDGLNEVPDFTPHRQAVKAADPSPADTTIKQMNGMVSQGFESVAAQVCVSGGTETTGLTLEVLLWSDLDGLFVSQNPKVQYTAVKTSQVINFSTGGQRFFISVTGTFDANVQVDIACAGINPRVREHA